MNENTKYSVEQVIEEAKSFPIRTILRYYGCTDNEGTNNMGCSFHKSKHHMSLYIKEDKNTCACVSEECGLSGDTLAVIALYEDWDLRKDFISKILPKAYDIVGREMPDLEISDKDKERINRFNIIKKANQIFYNHSKELLTEDIREYIKNKRKITDSQLDSLELGFFPKESFDKLKVKLIQQIPNIEEVCIINKTGENKFLLNSYYSMSNRIIHPHFYKGDILYITGEVSPNTDDKDIKYKKLNSSFAVYGNAEGYLLDGLNCKDKSHIIISEGYWDALTLKLLGFNTITFGTCKVSNYFIEKYSEYLKSFNNVITCFDVEENEAGIAGALSLNNKLTQKGIFNTFIAELKSKDGNKTDIESFVQDFVDIEEKKKAVYSFIIEEKKAYYEYFIEEAKDNLDETKLKDFLYYLQDCGSRVYKNKIIENIRKVLKLKVSDINDLIKDKKKEFTFNEVEEEDKFRNYKLEKSELGYLLIENKIINEEPARREVVDFDKIELQDRCSFDMITNEFKARNVYFLKSDKKSFLTEDNIDLKNTLKSSKRDGVKINRRDEEAFINFVNKFESNEVSSTNCYGFIDGKYIDYPTYRLHTEVGDMINGDIKLREQEVSVSDDYKRFINTKPNLDKIEKLKDMIENKYPRSEQEKLLHKLIFSWSISSALKMVLKHNGCNFHPILIALGFKNTGKTTAMKLFVSNLWNTEFLTVTDFEGSKGARFKHLDTTLFPIYCDEVMSLDRYANEMKTSAVEGYFKLTRGNKDGGVYNIIKFFNFSISANKWGIKDSALKSRTITFDYNEDSKAKLKDTEIYWMHKNIYHLGKHIYNSFKDYDFKTLIKEINKELIDEGIKDSRDRFKIIYIKLGSKILEDIGLYKDVKIENDYILYHEDEVSISIVDDIKDIVKDIIIRNRVFDNDTKRVIGVNTIIEASKEEKEELFTEEIYEGFANIGIYFTRGFNHILIGDMMRVQINKELQKQGYKEGKYKTLGQLAIDITGEKYKNTPRKVQTGSDGKIISKKGIIIFDCNELIDSHTEGIDDEIIEKETEVEEPEEKENLFNIQVEE